MEKNLHRDFFWRSLEEVGLEHLRLSRGDDFVRADGLIVRELAGMALRINYLILCDAAMRFRSLELLVDSGIHCSLELFLDESGRWKDGHGREISQLAGCREVDISITPFTNSLALGRLALQPGESARIRAAYIDLPEMVVSPVDQRYTRVGPSEYLYEALFGDFRASLPVDKDLLVLDYPEKFRREA